MMEDESDEEGVTESDLKRVLKEVRAKKEIFKLQHKMKKSLRARSKNKKNVRFSRAFGEKGINANIDSLKQRIKSRRSIKDLEGK